MGGKAVPIHRRIAASLSIAFIRITRILPLPIARAIMLVFGRIAYYFVPRIRKVGMQNLYLAYGDTLTRAEKKRILKESVNNIALVAAEFSRGDKIGDNLERYLILEDTEKFNPQRGGVLISGHIANWEWMIAGAASINKNILVVVRTLDEPRLNALVDAIRCGAGIRSIPKDDAGVPLFMHMGDNGIAGIMADQCPSNSAVPTTFFGQPCWSTIGPAMLAIKANVPVYMVQMVRQPDMRYRMTFLDPIEMECTGNTRDDIRHNTQRIQDAIEKIVRANPGQWLWLHKRWKARPKLQEAWDERLKRG